MKSFYANRKYFCRGNEIPVLFNGNTQYIDYKIGILTTCCILAEEIRLPKDINKSDVMEMDA